VLTFIFITVFCHEPRLFLEGSRPNEKNGSNRRVDKMPDSQRTDPLRSKRALTQVTQQSVA